MINNSGGYLKFVQEKNDQQFRWVYQVCTGEI